MDLKCQYEDWGLVLDKPVTLLCGNTLCRQHLDGFEVKFKCYFCHKQHSVPEEGYFVNKTIEKMIENFYQSDQIRKDLKDSYNKLNEFFNDEQINSDLYISNYIGEIVKKIVSHRNEMIKKYRDKSEQIINQLMKREQNCLLNSVKLEKSSLNHLKPNDLQSWMNLYLSHYSLRIPKFRIEEFNDFLLKMINKIRQVEIETKKYKNNILMNEAIHFERHETGKLSFYSNNTKILSKDCGELIQSFNQYFEIVQSIQVDEKLNKLISLSKDSKIKIWNLETGHCLKTLCQHKNEVTSILITPNKKLISASYDKTIKIWDLEAGVCLKTLNDHEKYVNCILIMYLLFVIVIYVFV